MKSLYKPYKMEKSTKIKILVLIVVYILLWNIEARAGTPEYTLSIPLVLTDGTCSPGNVETTFLVNVHGLPVQINISLYNEIWNLNIVELIPLPTVMPTVSPTVNPTITVSPTVSPTVGPTVNPPTSGYVASQSSTKFHLPDCYHVSRILPANLVHFATREEALASGRTPCGTCQP